MPEITEQCCHLHGDGDCCDPDDCDPDDCGPCCVDCPSCPTLQRMRALKGASE